jgi:hypothetical protein
METTRKPIILLCRDLLLASRVRAAAEGAGVALVTVRDPAKVGGTEGVTLIVDCNLAGALGVVGEFRAREGARVVGFASHADVETIQLARAAGVERVVARSAFLADPLSYVS